ncbi:hypothetical protein [Crocosphaera chwakensis]|uniref:Uncharacterized protein n=1 Tax=Crocosphaera chwakensis CCY0110 TaxID=391612 RepID=A3INN3_9CHRO|nr:hypothetical protein [Crocosphaera chwakensis]EAZ91931.1 hypothetical protein CY0110_29689 [Crocosphaera chwakensis CCY0110]
MEDWQKDLTEWMENVAVAVEGFVDEVGQSVETAAEDFQNDVVREIDQFLDDVFTPLADISIEEEFQGYYYYHEYHEDSDLMLSPKIEPTHNVHPACRGCIHYHGRLYGKHLFVCGMHPYGSNTDACPDWEESNNK